MAKVDGIEHTRVNRDAIPFRGGHNAPSWRAQQLDEPIDLLLGVVAMRADAESAGAVIDNNPGIAAPAFELLQVAARNDQRYDAGLFGSRAAAENFDAILVCALAQVIGHF